MRGERHLCGSFGSRTTPSNKYFKSARMWGSPDVVHWFQMNLAVGRLNDTGNEASGEENH